MHFHLWFCVHSNINLYQTTRLMLQVQSSAMSFTSRVSANSNMKQPSEESCLCQCLCTYILDAS